MRILIQKKLLFKVLKHAKIVYTVLIFALFAQYAPSALSKDKVNKKIESINHAESPISPKQAMSSHTEHLRALMLQLYEMHPQELAKSTKVGAREITEWVFDGKANWRFDAIRNMQGNQALALMLDPSYQHDQVLALVVGLETLLFSAYGGENEFQIPASSNPQQLTLAKCHMQTLLVRLNQNANNPEQSLAIVKQKESLLVIEQTINTLIRDLENTRGVSAVCA